MRALAWKRPPKVSFELFSGKYGLETSEPILSRVLICHRDPYFREGLRSVLRKLTGEDAAAVADRRDALALAGIECPDVVLLELGTPSGQGALRLFHQLQQLCPSLRDPVIICPPERLAPTVTVPLIEGGAACVIAEDAQPEEFTLVIAMLRRAIQPRHSMFARDLRELAAIARRGLEPCERCGYQPNLLTPREREIVEMVSAGNSNRLIARKLRLSEATIKNHLHAAFRRLNVSNRAELVSEATRLGLIGPSVIGPNAPQAR